MLQHTRSRTHTTSKIQQKMICTQLGTEGKKKKMTTNVCFSSPPDHDAHNNPTHGHVQKESESVPYYFARFPFHLAAPLDPFLPDE